MSVSIIPQTIVFTWILLGASSLAKALVKELTAPLLLEYATSHEDPTFLHMDEILIILPNLFLSIASMANFEQLNTELRLDEIT